MFAERKDTTLDIEPYFFPSVESFDHLNVDNSRDKVEEFKITTVKDSGNRVDKYSGMFSLKNGSVDTLLTFHSFAFKSLKEPWFKYEPGVIVEEENLFQVADNDGDGKIEISNRMHKKHCNKELNSGKFTFTYDSKYGEYKLQKGKVIKVK
ncbi:MAG: hypothetical protein JWQ96_2268 [Segetibacter sp.]|nr:hypothetical protein [Segetibacter sp.]